MVISFESIIEIGKVLGALGLIGGFLVVVYNIIKAPAEQKKETDSIREMHTADIKEIKAELCVMNYALLATLDGLKQLKCNGNVTKAYDMLEKHLNKQAHDQT